jgi:(p)ppGpp synthase/HD superfamily hydrolase
MNLINEALQRATICHENQVDKGGKPYIMHPLRIMMRLERKYGCDEHLLCAAILHDAVEDDPTYTIGDVLNVFGSDIAKSVESLTHIKGESYENYLARISLDKVATLVKMEDLKDNSDIHRLKGVEDKDFLRMMKYHRAYKYLENIKENFIDK